MFGQGNAEVLDLLQRDIGAAKEGKAGHDAGQRPHQVEGGDDIAGQGLLVEMKQGGDQEQDQPDESEVKQVRPILSGNEANLGGDIVALVNGSGGFDVTRKEGAAAGAVQLEFLDAFGQSAEVTEELIFLGAGQDQMTEGAADH